MGANPAAVIFDFDGVLVDTERLHYLAFQDVLAPEGLGYGWEAYVASYIGFDDRDALRHRFVAAGLPCPAPRMEELLRRKAEAFLRRVGGTDLPLYPGVSALMEACAAAGVPVGLCSGATRADIDAILGGVRLPASFAARITADDVAASKPDPESYRRVVAAMAAAVPGLDPDPARMVAIEDTPHGIAAARGAGLRVVGVATTHPVAALAEADWAVARLEECGLADLARLVDAG
jgi:beta-phosphoglucomutase